MEICFLGEQKVYSWNVFQGRRDWHCCIDCIMISVVQILMSIFYRRLQRLGIFWPEMASDSKEEQQSCKTCSVIPPDQAEVLNRELLKEDWQEPYLRYLCKEFCLLNVYNGRSWKDMWPGLKWWVGNCSRGVSKGNGWYAFLLRNLMVFSQTYMRENQQDTLVGGSCGKWLCTRDITGPQCKEVLKILQENVKNAKGREMKYTPVIKVFIQLWLHIHSTVRS